MSFSTESTDGVGTTADQGNLWTTSTNLDLSEEVRLLRARIAQLEHPQTTNLPASSSAAFNLVAQNGNYCSGLSFLARMVVPSCRVIMPRVLCCLCGSTPSSAVDSRRSRALRVAVFALPSDDRCDDWNDWSSVLRVNDWAVYKMLLTMP
uniref:Uncharacterized protein n=2 Tax=Globodera rostochiensis TaxID=31243 RepID=A0A914HIP2_GLORO